VKVVLLGAAGMLGRDLAAASPQDVELIPLSRQQLDITDARRVTATLDNLRPDVVINAAGYTDVDRAERERSTAFAVNATATERLADACARRDIAIVHFSTDYVFDGRAARPYTEDDLPAPINVYGESKLAGERGLLATGARFTLIRSQWLFGLGGVSFPRTMWQRARNDKPVRVVDDQRGRPTSTIDLAQATWELIKRKEDGVFHVANSGDASWYDIAEVVFVFQSAIERLARCTSAALQSPADRPSYSVLDTSRADRALGGPQRHWRDALAAFLEALAVYEEPRV
jgi:dTDP-4-dehydrorhamnose reductase